MRRFEVNQECCIGCETCVGLAPKAFEMDEATGKSRAINGDGAVAEEVEEAMGSCPGSCIHWQDG